MWSYWIIGLASMLEAFFVTGVFVPGTLIVDAGGILVQQGALDYFDLVWFVAVGSVLGSEAGYWTGILARRGLSDRWRPEQFASYQRAEQLFQRHGGLALVIGRFLGPVSGLVPFAASVAGMDRRKFLIWNLISGVPYALAHVAFGYFLGDVLSSFGPIATRVALLAGAVTILIVILWWLVIRIRRMLPFVLSIARSVISAITENPDVTVWTGRHPRFSAFIAHRFDRDRFSGLTATLLGLTFFYILLIWAGTVLDFLMADPIVQIDMRIANLIHAFRDPALLRLSSYVTALGDWRTVALLAAAAAVWLMSGRRVDLVVGLAVAVVGNVISVSILKAIFHRPRPELAYFVATSGSFPSGHAAISVAFFGMLFYVSWRKQVIGPLMAAIMAVTVAFAIGLSRLYLIEHYLSDVLNGWLVGTLWLVIGITITEWWREAHSAIPPIPPSPQTAPGKAWRVARPVAVTLLVAVAGWNVATYDKAHNISLAVAEDRTIPDVASFFVTDPTSTQTQSVTGIPLEPVNIIVLATDGTALSSAMVNAGWLAADRPSLSSLTRTAWAAWTNKEDELAPVAPYFWSNRPNDLAFQKPSSDRTLGKRHIVRFWETNVLMPDGRRMLVGAASFDDRLDWGLLPHIDPNIDAERDTLATDLSDAGLVEVGKRLQVSSPGPGQSVAGDLWFTDGRVVVLTLKP